MMPRPKEVNAWARYEQTARTPRKLSSGTDHHRDECNDGHRLSSTCHQFELAFRRHHGENESRHRPLSCHPAIDLSPPLERSTANDGENNKETAVAEVDPFPAALAKQEEGVSDDSTRLYLGKAGPNLDVDILEKIRTTFDIFFEGGLATTEVQKNKNSGNSSMMMGTSWLGWTNATMPWIQEAVQSPILLFVDLCLRGMGQVVFQNSPLTGLLILIGLFIQSPRVASHGALAVVVTNGVALILGFDKGLAASGLFGYNAFLVGLALATFDSEQEFLATTLLASIGIASFTSILFVMMGKLLVPYKSPPLTLPFNVATILFLLATANMGRVSYGSVRHPALPVYLSDAHEEDFSITTSQFFAGTVWGLGQVFLANHLATGFLVLVGMAFCSRISAVAALAGSALGTIMAVATGSPPGAIEAGLYGFNSSLSVTAILMFYSPSLGAGVLATFAGIFTVLAQQALDAVLVPWGLPFMTLPFCIACLPFIIIQGTTSIVVAVPLASMTVPEDHFQVVKMLSDGFAFLREALTEPGNKSMGKKQRHKLSRSLNLLSDALEKAQTCNMETSQGNQHLCPCINKSLPLSKTNEVAKEIHQALLIGADDNSLPISQIMCALQAAGLHDSEALNFTRLILNFIDSNQKGSIGEAEFVAFALTCCAMKTIRAKTVKFLEFVDENGNGMVSFQDMDAALEYLGQPALDAGQKEQLLELSHFFGHGTDNKNKDDNEMDVIVLANVVTLANVKKVLTSAFHGCDSTASSGNIQTGWSNSFQVGVQEETKTGAETVDVVV